jgi:23S rRNA pseudouridine1911/1915/1917 synthase
MKILNFTITLDTDGKRLDVFLSEVGLDLSKRKIKSIIDMGGAYVNQKRIRIASHVLRRGDKVRIQFSDEALRKIKQAPPALKDQDILYDSDHVIAINKPAGLPSQATMDQALVHVIPQLEAYLKARGDTRSPLVLVHRLDKETTGVILVAVGNEKATWLTKQFRERLVKKTYYAICHGLSKRDSFTETAPLSEIDRKTGNVRAVQSGGRPAVTHFKVLAVNKDLKISLLECRPETGRSHQIRVHLDINGLPIVGDKRYGGKNPRPLPDDLTALASHHHFLHAGALDFVPAPNKEAVRIEAPFPETFAQFLDKSSLS